MIKYIIKSFLVIAFIMLPFFTEVIIAAGMGTGPPQPCGGPFPPCPVPLDGGTALLLIAGAVYGGKKIYDSIKKNPV